jgi:phosphoribosylaminoimidazole-succinocarboxamide synthase
MEKMKLETIKETNFTFDGQTSFYKGKVRDVYGYQNDKLIFIVTDRISAFDFVLPLAIPYKGEILNLIAAKFLKITEDIVPNWLINVPDPAVSIGYKCKPIPVEMVIRGYLCGHAWREYKSGKRLLSGVAMPNGMIENQIFPKPIITPTTKALEGHDEDISRDEIISSGLVDADTYAKLEDLTYKLFERGTQYAAKQGLILVDTKYEFGIYNGKIYLIDEIHTPDSSRYFYAADYYERFKNNQPQRQLSKEFVREWLMEKGFQGKEGDVMPEMTDEVVEMIMNRYIELYEIVTGEKFVFSDRTHLENRLKQNILNSL